MRYALVIAMLLGSTLLAQAEPIDRSGSRRLEKRANLASLNFGRNSGKTRAAITHAV